MKRIIEALFGGTVQKVCWGIGVIACVVLFFVYGWYIHDLEDCKKTATELYGCYKKVNGKMASMGDDENYDIDSGDMKSYNMAYNAVAEKYRKLTKDKRDRFSSWFEKKYDVSYKDFMEKCSDEDNVGQSADYDWEQFLTEYRTEEEEIQNLEKCKECADALYDCYRKINGNLTATTTIDDEEYYDIDSSDMESYNNAYNIVVEKYKELAEDKEDEFLSWFENKYGISYKGFMRKCSDEDNMGQSSDYDWEQFLEKYRIKAEGKIEIVSQQMVADGNYFDFTATFKNGTSETISYIKYTIFVHDKDGNLVDSDWSTWTGTFLPGAMINVDTMVKKYPSEEGGSFAVVIDEYN